MIRKNIYSLEDTIERLQGLMLDQVSSQQTEDAKLTMSAIDHLQELEKVRQMVHKLASKS